MVDLTEMERNISLTKIRVIDEIANERQRQIDAEGWTPEHDDEHEHGQMAKAAACYTLQASIYASSPMYCDETPSIRFPWSSTWWKPKNPRRDLIRAAALIVAEIERLDRKASNTGIQRRASARPL